NALCEVAWFWSCRHSIAIISVGTRIAASRGGRHSFRIKLPESHQEHPGYCSGEKYYRQRHCSWLLRRDIDSPHLVEVEAKHGKGIVYKVRKYGNQKAARPEIQIAKEYTQQESGHKAEELHMKCAEQQRSEPDGNVCVASNVPEFILEKTTKHQLFTDGRNYGNYQQR